MAQDRVIIIGAGVGGLISALLLAARGIDVTVLEAAAAPGGKMSETVVAGRSIDAGPTVFTMRDVFDAILADVGENLDDHLALTPAAVLARHAWGPEGYFDLFADRAAATDAVERFFGGQSARDYEGFCQSAKAIHDAVAATFITGEKPSQLSVPLRIGLAGGAMLLKHRAFSTLWSVLTRQFSDPRLRQLFGRYATYCGSSPFLAPAMLMLVAHVEQQGVWLVDGGMIAVARMLARLAEKRGATIRCGATVSEIVVERGRATSVVLATGERISADAIVFNGDVAALGQGLLGENAAAAAERVQPAKRSLSAVTWSLVGCPKTFPLVRHTVVFGGDYAREFAEIGQGRLPTDPTVYICASDRAASLNQAFDGPERLFCLVNAPAVGDIRAFPEEEIETCRTAAFERMARCGLTIDYEPTAMATTSPAHFGQRFPGTGGALYGAANHDLNASFRRPGSRTRLPGLYLAGGSVHPGPGVPMAALSGRQAATALLADFASMRPSSRAAIAGGTSTPSATTVRKA
jgi:1-hydroxycarotenoid 3,4-desaturase